MKIIQNKKESLSKLVTHFHDLCFSTAQVPLSFIRSLECCYVINALIYDSRGFTMVHGNSLGIGSPLLKDTKSMETIAQWDI